MPPTIPSNSEIDKALKEFEAKSSQVGAVKGIITPEVYSVSKNEVVEGVKFETDSYKAVKYYNETEAPKMIKLVMKFSGGAIKEERQAEWILFGFVVVAMAVSLYLFLGGGNFKIGGNKIITPEEMNNIMHIRSQ